MHQPQPLLVINGSLQDPKECYLVAEKTVILKGDFDNAIGLLLASFFVFNIHYPPGLSNFYTILEIILLHQLPKKYPLTVSNILARLNYEKE